MSLKTQSQLIEFGVSQHPSLGATLGAVDARFFTGISIALKKCCDKHNIDAVYALQFLAEADADRYTRYVELSKKLNKSGVIINMAKSRKVNILPKEKTVVFSGTPAPKATRLDAFEQMVQEEVDRTGASWHKAMATLVSKHHSNEVTNAQRQSFFEAFGRHKQAVIAKQDADHQFSKAISVVAKEQDLVASTEKMLAYNSRVTGDAMSDVIKAFAAQEPLRYTEYKLALQRQMGL
jgi:hypothetical protein